VVLFDEVEKAHPDIFNSLLQILEEGRLTDSQGRKVDFKNTVIIMTTNLGTRDINKGVLTGFQSSEHQTHDYARMKSKVSEELKQHFRPEFLNRVDDTIVFPPLQKDEIKDRGENVKDLAGSMPADWLGSLTFSLSPSLVNKMWENIDSLPASSQRQLKNLGISSADDLHALVGTQFSVAFTGDSNTLRAGFKVRTKDPEKHKSIVEKITRTGSLKDAKTTVEGDTVTTTFGTDIGTFSNPGEKLSANSDYEKLTKGIDNPQAAAWVNVPQVLKAMDKNSSNGMPKQLKENLESISGIGMVAGQIDDHYFDSWVRVGTK